MSGFDTVIYEKERHVARVTLNRPEVLNAYSLGMRDDLYEVLSAVRDDDEVRVVILRGAGPKAFCSGADLKEFLTAPSASKARWVREVRDLWRLLAGMPQPLVAELHGYVLGSGMEIALLCDLRIASEDVLFGLPEVNLGIMPGAGGTQTLPRIMGLAGSLDMLLTGRRLNGREALRMGLIHRLVAAGELAATADGLAQKIASCDPAAVQSAKHALIAGMDLTLAQGLELERNLAARLGRKRRRRPERPES
jgi:enoyl-CoA hydratase/carnithine racemase